MGSKALRSGGRASPWTQSLAVWGPGLLVMLADTDAGNVVTAAQGGARWGYRLLPLVVLLIPVLYMVQELTVRLGVFTGRGHGELVRERFGPGWALLSTAGLAAATVGSLITEFTGVAGVGEMFGLARGVTLTAAAGALLAVAATGSYKRVERAALAVGLFELAFFALAWLAHPRLAAVAAEAADWPVRDAGFMVLVAAIIGATFNPWMIFYQQSATVDKRLGVADLRHARLDTAAGAALTQCLTGAVLVAAAAALAAGTAFAAGTAAHSPAELTSVGEVGEALTSSLGREAGRVVFGAGVLGASLVAAIVSSLALAWGIGEVSGHRRALQHRPFEARWFYGVYAAAVAGSALAVFVVRDLVWLNVAAQVFNAFLMPPVVGLLIALAVAALPPAQRPRGWYLGLLIACAGGVSLLGVFGGVQALL